MSKRVMNKLKYDIPLYYRPILSVEEATTYSGIGNKKVYELAEMNNCPFVIHIGRRKVIKKKTFVEYLEQQYSI